MLFSIVAEDHPDSLELRLGARPEHLSRLEALEAAGRLVLAGPFPAEAGTQSPAGGFTGSLIVADFESLEAAQAFAATDPYTVCGVYARVTVKPFRKVFPS